MPSCHCRLWSACLAVLLLCSSGTGFAQTLPAALGLSDEAARNYVLGALRSGQASPSSDVLAAAWAAYKRVPAAERLTVGAAIFAWARAYVNSATFAADYATIRNERMPPVSRRDGSIDDEVKRKVAEELAGLEEMLTRAASLPPEQRALLVRVVMTSRETVRSREHQQALRAEIERTRAAATPDLAVGSVTDWERMYPADPRLAVARKLREFLEMTANVDYAAKTELVSIGEVLRPQFVKPEYREKPWPWLPAVLVGKDVVTGARMAAEVWLRELGSRNSP